MKLETKYILGFLVLIVLGAFYIAYSAEYPDQRLNAPQTASTTSYALTWGAVSTRIVATSSPNVRTALTVQAVNCAVGGQVWLNFNDTLAATNTTYSLQASTTATFGDQHPMAYGSIRALASSADCRLNVTEYRLPY